MSSGRTLVRNAGLNLVGLLAPLLLAVIAIPELIRGLGPERFGILTLAWATIGYLSLFEFGLGRALTQSLAQRLGNGRHDDLGDIAWTTLLLLLMLGIAAGAFLAIATPAIVRILAVPGALERETIVSFYILAGAMPLVTTSAGMRGMMEAHQHFGAVNALRIPLAVVTFLGPLLILPLSRTLGAAVGVLVAGRAVVWMVTAATCARRYDYLRRPPRYDGDLAMSVIRYGGWTTVTNAVSPLMVYMDRFVVGSVISLGAVTLYVTPYEVVTKLMIVPGAVIGAVFPAFAATFGAQPDVMSHLYDRSQRMVIAIIFPAALIATTFAAEGLRAWAGGLLTPESAVALQWLAVGVFINSIAHAPNAALQSVGRPDLVARLHLIELPIYAALLGFLVQRFGIIGVAIAWTLRVAIDTLALLAVAHRTLKLAPLGQPRNAHVFLVLLLALVIPIAIESTWAKAVYVMVASALFAVLAHQWLVTPFERAAVIAWLRPVRRLHEGP